MEVVSTTGASLRPPVEWHSIHWKKAHRNVRRLQTRIVKALREGKKRKVRALQFILTRSFSGRAVAVRRVTENQGKNTPGVDNVVWNNPAKKSQAISELRHSGYHPQPLKRVFIPKSDGRLRPLSIPTMKDRAMQALHLLALDPIAETTADPNSYGFRKERSTADAIEQSFAVLSRKNSAQYILDADIKACFDSLDHQVMLSILNENLRDNRFLRLLSNLLKAGYLEDWKYHATLGGVPQGGVVSPVLSNVYLDRLDQFVKCVLLPTYNYGEHRKPSPPYMALLNAARNNRIAGNHEEAKKLRQQAQQMPSRDPNDPEFRRLWYVRYADDWLLGFSGPRDEAEQIKVRMREFLQDELKLELSQEKTLITNARTEAARFLGYEIINQHADDKHCRKQRSINGASGLKVPVDVIREKCLKYMRHGKPIQRAERLNDTDFSIIAQYQAEYRGVVQYYLKAFNVHRLRQLYQVMKLSLAKTLADKHRTSVAKVIRKYQTTVPAPHGRLKVLQVIRQRGEKKKPLVARFGGIELRRQKDAVINDRPPEVYNSLRSEIVQRLLADQCELCGSEDNCEVHHVRKLADLDQPGQKEKPLWAKRMAARRRKTLVVCQKCHEDIHRERSPRRKSTA